MHSTPAPAVLRRTGDDADHAAGVLVVGRAGHAAAAARTSAASSTCADGSRQVEADVDQPHLAGELRTGADDQPGLERAEGHGDVGLHGLAGDRAGVRIDAGRQVDRHRQRVVRCRRERRRVVAQPARSADAEDPVDDQIGRDVSSGRPRRPVHPHAAARPGPRRAPGRARAAAPSREHPARASRAPAYSASPPLLPAPTSSITRAPYTDPSSCAHCAASPAAARCISAPSGSRAISVRFGRPHLVDGVDAVHAFTPSAWRLTRMPGQPPKRYADSAITVAAAIPPSCESETCQRVTPSDAARSATVPRHGQRRTAVAVGAAPRRPSSACRRRRRAPWPAPPWPRSARPATRRCAARRARSSTPPRVNSRSRQRRRTLQRLGEPHDRHDVDPDADDHVSVLTSACCRRPARSRTGGRGTPTPSGSGRRRRC